ALRAHGRGRGAVARVRRRFAVLLVAALRRGEGLDVAEGVRGAGAHHGGPSSSGARPCRRGRGGRRAGGRDRARGGPRSPSTKTPAPGRRTGAAAAASAGAPARRSSPAAPPAS